MLLVWGWKTVFRIVGSGVFSCPSCGGDRNYERRRAQRFFTLFFIPLIPLKVVGEFIRCTACKNDFRESVLARPTSAQFTDLLQNTVRGVMVNVLRRGGGNHPAARAIAVQEIVTAGAVGYTDMNLAQDLQVVPEDLTQMLTALGGQLPQSGREAMVLGATRVAVADGPLSPAERAVIDTVGAGLGMTQTHVAGVVASVSPAVGAQTGPQDAAPPQFQTQVDPSGAMETMMLPPRPAPAPDNSAMETMMLPSKPAQDSAAMETMAIPTAQAPQTAQIPSQRPLDPAEEPTHVTQSDPDPGSAGWAPQQR
ncbi:MAG: TerB family tellurite resistance protein [Catenulisporales bacterium]|nr:TerB family tellurite resistance protein [Catenulisporales bacterium]